MIELTPEAEQQLDELRRHFEGLGRLEALRNLRIALNEGSERIARAPGIGLPAPRPYPGLTSPGRLWLKAGRYWIAYRSVPRLAIVAVFYDTADIPGRASGVPTIL